MIENKKIAKRYARAFLHGEAKTDEIDKLIEEVRELDLAMQADDAFRSFMTSPVYAKERKRKVMHDLAEKLGFSQLTRSLIDILIKKDRIGIVADVYEELRSVSDRLHERVRVTLTTAHEPTAEELADMTARISAYFGRTAVVDRTGDESLIGGFIIEGEGKRIDMSIRGQIERLVSQVS